MKKKALVVLTLLAVLLASVCVPALAEENKFYFDKSVRTLFEGDTLQLQLIRMGDCREEGTLTFSSSRPDNAAVDANGLVTGTSKGGATITATLKTQKRTWKCTIELNVIRKVESIEVNEEKLAVYLPEDPVVAGLIQPPAEGEEPSALPVLLLRAEQNQSITATLLPKDANNRRFVLTSSDETIVRVNSNNFIPKKAGECIVTVQSEQNPEISVSYRALVVQPVKQLKLSASAKSIYVGQTLQLTPAYSPENATIKAVNWSSNNESIATVDENGVVTGRKRGECTIKAQAADGSGRWASYTVNVLQQPTEITLNETSLVVNTGSYKTLKATVGPSNANDKNVEWSSSDPNVAKVASGGRVTGVTPGTCVITCRSKNFPEVYTTATVEVHQLVTRVVFAEKSVNVNVGETAIVYWSTEPANATNTAVKLTSNNTKVATVDQNGVITALKRGECTITAAAQDGSGRKGTVKVNVIQPVEGVHMKNDTVSVGVNENASAYAVLEPADASITRMSWTSADPSIATVKGSNTRATVTGKRWGTTTITGVTEDGGYTTSATVNVGNYDKALIITDLYVSCEDGLEKIRINVYNESNMNITKFYYTIECYDTAGEPLPCHTNGGHMFTGVYSYTLYEGDTTRHGRFSFQNFVRPQNIGRVVMTITGYRTDDGYSRTIRENRYTPVEYVSPLYAPPTAPPPPGSDGEAPAA